MGLIWLSAEVGDAAGIDQSASFDHSNDSQEEARLDRFPVGIRFQPCPENTGAECGTVPVPVNYEQSGHDRVELAVIRVRATNPQARIGVLFLGPGGPGFSGIDIVLRGLQLMPPAARRVLERFDVVSFDERGSGRSRSIHCDMPAAGFPLDPDPVAAARFLDEFSQRVADTCVDQNGVFVRTMSTNNIARDVDMVRRALGERTITFLGASAGTELGAVYASLFPRHVRAMVLDAGFPPEYRDNWVEFTSEQAIAFELALQRLDLICRGDAACPLHDIGAVPALDALMTRLGAQPLPIPNGSPLTGEDVRNVVADLLYLEPTWPLITKALSDGLAGDYRTFVARRILARQNIRLALQTTSFDAYDAILCNDFGTRRPAREILPVGEALRAQAPHFFGPYYLAGEVARCAAWPSSDTPVIRNVAHELKTPVVFVGNDFDPATPLTWTRSLAHALGMERNVIRYQGGGHGAYLTKGNTCIDTAIEPYLFDLRLPPEGMVCPAQLLEFSASASSRASTKTSS